MKTKPKKFRIKRLFQFSLRSMMLVTLASAIGVNWWLRPEPQTIKLPGGGTERIQMLTKKDKQTKQEYQVNHGLYEARDRYGRLLCRGQYANGKAAGRWTFFHANGRKAMRGYCEKDCLTGVWSSWNSKGVKTSEVTYGPPQEKYMSPQFSKNETDPWLVSVREGTASRWWENKQPQSLGDFLKDHREGPWVFQSAEGKQTAAGIYRRGLKHGDWQQQDGKGDSKTQHYISGRKAIAYRALMPRLKEDLQSDNWQTRYDAMQMLAEIGDEAAYELLMQSLRSDDDEHRLVALHHLTKMTPTAKSALPEIRPLAEAADVETQCAALMFIYVMDETSRPESLRELILLSGKESDRLQNIVTRWLFEQKETSLPIMEKMLADPTPEIRYRVLASLAKMLDIRNWRPSPRPLIPILEKAEQDPDPLIAEAAENALKQYNRPRFQGGFSGGYASPPF